VERLSHPAFKREKVVWADAMISSRGKDVMHEIHVMAVRKLSVTWLKFVIKRGWPVRQPLVVINDMPRGLWRLPFDLKRLVAEMLD